MNYSFYKKTAIAAGILIVTSFVAVALAQDTINNAQRVRRESEVETDFESVDDNPEVFDNIYSAISEAGSDQQRPKRQNRQKQSSQTQVQKQQQQQSRSGRQEKEKIPGFPNGLPSQVPEGVRIALESAQRGPGGEFIMNPIPGQAGVDFPVLASVPETNFNCNTQQFPGIYADQDADCQVFHMCQPNGNSDSFLCPNGSIFNQQYFVCDWWYNVDCSASPSFYSMNEFIYQDQPEGKKCKSLFCIDD